MIVVVATGALCAPTFLRAHDVQPGVDMWATPAGSYSEEFDSTEGGTPLPADFFGPGSDPFDGAISLQGKDFRYFGTGGCLAPADAIIWRKVLALLPFPPCPSTAVIPIEIIALSLTSSSPITVTYTGGSSPEPWDVDVCLSDYAQQQGSMQITHLCPDGGSFSSTLPVTPKFTFTRRSDGATRVLDVGDPDSVYRPVVLSTSSGTWVHSALFPITPAHAGDLVDGNCDGTSEALPIGTSNFYPGIFPSPCICSTPPGGSYQYKELTEEQELLAAHGIIPPWNPLDSDGDGIPDACDPDQQLCPLPTLNPWCSALQWRDCEATAADETCLPLEVRFDSPTAPPTILLCDCFSGIGCGPVDIQLNTGGIGYTVSCQPVYCPPGQMCYIHLNGVSQGVGSIDSSQTGGAVVTCECELAPPPPVCPLGSLWCSGLQLIDCITTGALETCYPREVTVDPSGTGQPIVRVCDCFSDLAAPCGPVSITGNGTIGYTFSCPGPCLDPIEQTCQLHFNGTPQGVSSIGSLLILPGTKVTCACAEQGPALCPPAVLECIARQAEDCQSTTGQCLPKVIRHNVPPALGFFPPAGEDLLKSTTGHVEVISPLGERMMYYIRESPQPNTTTVVRGSPRDEGDHRRIDTEITEMELVGVGGGGGGGAVLIRESPMRYHSTGGVTGAAGGATDYPAESFFDVFVEIDIPEREVYGLYNMAPIHLDAHGITAVPPLGSSFKTPEGWLVMLYDAYGATGYRIGEVLHEIPPPDPPEWEVIECACMNQSDCRVTRDLGIEPTCVGGCQEPPPVEICTEIITSGQNFVDYTCECVGPVRDHVVCEPQDLNPAHPNTYWYDVTTSWLTCDFHVLVLDPTTTNYTNGTINPWPGDTWVFSVHQVGNETWASWWTPQCAEPIVAPTVTHRFQFNHNGPSAWSHWRTTYSGTDDPYDPYTIDMSQNHALEPDGYGYRVHVPLPPGVVTQACCLQNGTCVDVEYNKCVALGGDPQGPGTMCTNPSVVCTPLKWAQPPTYGPFIAQQPECFWGWDEHSHYQSLGCAIVADDWACTTNQPITDIHWWGSYQQWTTHEPPPIAPEMFHIGIWTDVPAGEISETCCYCYNPPMVLPPTTCSPNPRDQAECDQWGGGQYEQCTYFPSSRCMEDHCEAIQPLPYSHPGKMIWESIVPRTLLNERYVGCDEYPGQPLDTCFRYDFDIPESQWFYQRPSADPTIYWISISAFYMGPPPQFPWGWKTREHFFNDDAVRIFAPNPPLLGSEFIEGVPIVTPDGESWDMAFVLTTNTPGPSKWDQWPDVSLPGLHAADGTTLADNWECQGGLVTDLHWWGNYELDGQGHERRGAGIECINLSIHANNPVDPWCLPQDPELWGVCALFSALNEHDTGMVNSEGSKIYQYTFYLAPGWPQRPGDIYWLDIEAQSIKPANPALWRWQENSRDAAPRLCPAAERTTQAPWHTIVWPGAPTPRYSEMAFRITSGPYPPPNTIVWDPATNPTLWPNNNPAAATRSLKFTVTGPATPSTVDAIQVTMVNLQDPQPPNAVCCPPKNFGCWEAGAACGTVLPPVPPAVGVCTGTGETGGCARWVGKPGTFYEAQGPPLSGPYRAARLQCSVFYWDWVTETASGAISVVGAEIVPSSEYSVQTYGASCAGNENTCTNVSAAVPMYTRRSGDAETAYNPPGTGQQPDASDVTALVNKFKKMAGAPLNFRSQLQPNLPELNTDVSASDIVAVVDAY
ncbi:MAG: hypothetical protein V1790_12935, partial [Planctomycetota bacterium]